MRRVKIAAETLGFLCSSGKVYSFVESSVIVGEILLLERYHGVVLEAGLTDALVYLMSLNDSDLQYWTATLLLTVVMTSGKHACSDIKQTYSQTESICCDVE